MDHIDENHIKKVSSWPTYCRCRTEVDDCECFCHHLSNEHGLWKTEWKSFSKKRLLEEDEDLMDPPGVSDGEDAVKKGQMKRRKLSKKEGTFIEWPYLAKSRFQINPLHGSKHTRTGRRHPTKRSRVRRKRRADLCQLVPTPLRVGFGRSI
jgi:hypothetical protein